MGLCCFLHSKATPYADGWTDDKYADGWADDKYADGWTDDKYAGGWADDKIVQHFLNIIADNRAGRARGIYAVCTAHPVVLEAALQQGKQDQAPVLIEATANQVNQFGGYTGMQPADFRPYIEAIAHRVGYPRKNILLGGDHLGPVVWSDELADSAMQKARELIDAYVRAGFKKIHLDTSMPCADDGDVLGDETVAARAAVLCAVAEGAARKAFGRSDLVYVIGTEVPPPGGAPETISGLRVSTAEAVLQTVGAHRRAFSKRGLDGAWSRVIGLVAQPGVEFDHTSVHDFVPEETLALSALIQKLPNLVFEAHSTDYQLGIAYSELVRRHFAILKVGPQLTYALREALFALSHIEAELITHGDQAHLPEVCEEVMQAEPEHWNKYYPDDLLQGRLYRRYSYSDRIRYYWHKPLIAGAVARLMKNLEEIEIPLPLLGFYMPVQYPAVRAGLLAAKPHRLIQHHIMQVTASYAAACGTACENSALVGAV